MVQMMHPKLVIHCHYNCPAFFTKNFNPVDEQALKNEVENAGILCMLLRAGQSIDMMH